MTRHIQLFPDRVFTELDETEERFLGLLAELGEAYNQLGKRNKAIPNIYPLGHDEAMEALATLHGFIIDRAIARWLAEIEQISPKVAGRLENRLRLDKLKEV